MKNNKTDFDSNTLRARILTRYGSGKMLTAAEKMDTEQIKTDNQKIDQEARLLANISKMTEEELDLFFKIMDLTDGRHDRLDFAASWTGRMEDLPAALAQI